MTAFRILILLVIFANLSWSAGYCLEGEFAQGVAAFRQGKYADALGLFDRAKAKSFDDPLLHYYLASTYIKLNYKDNAIQEYKMTMVLDPNGKLAPLCATALRSRGASSDAQDHPSKAIAKPSPAVSKVQSPQESTASGDKPTLVTYTCNREPECLRVNMLVADLRSKFGNRLLYKSLANVSDHGTSWGRHDLRKCPVIMFVHGEGQTANTFKANIKEEDLIHAISAVTKFKPSSTNCFLADKSQAILDDVAARIAADEVRVKQQIANIKKVGSEQSDSGQVSFGRSLATSSNGGESDRKIQVIQEDFERRKKEWYNHALNQLKGLQSSGSFKAEQSTNTSRGNSYFEDKKESILKDLAARISQDEIRLSESVRRLQRQAEEEADSRAVADFYTQINKLKEDAKKRKREWSETAEKQIRQLESSMNANKS